MGGGTGPKRIGTICRKVLTALVHPYYRQSATCSFSSKMGKDTILQVLMVQGKYYLWILLHDSALDCRRD